MLMCFEHGFVPEGANEVVAEQSSVKNVVGLSGRNPSSARNAHSQTASRVAADATVVGSHSGQRGGRLLAGPRCNGACT
jgi:hypothetical protein